MRGGEGMCSDFSSVQSVPITIGIKRTTSGLNQLLDTSFGLLELTTPDSIKKDSLDRFTWLVLPIAFYTPETRLGGGVAGITTFRFPNQDSTIRASQAQLGFAYTQEKQVLCYLPYQLFFGNQDYVLRGELGYYKYTFQYFGVGNNRPKDYREAFDTEFPRIRITGLKRVSKYWYVGGNLLYDYFKNTPKVSDGPLATSNVLGLGKNANASLGVTVNYDSRDNVFSAYTGFFTEVSLNVGNKQLLSDYNFTRLNVDVSKYFSVTHSTIIALNTKLNWIFGDQPFNSLAVLGGTKVLRGLYEGRFRDNQATVFQAEVRQHLTPSIGVVGFWGIGAVTNNPQDLADVPYRNTAGVGFRWLINKNDRVGLRVDYGFNFFEQGALYVTFNEAF